MQLFHLRWDNSKNGGAVHLPFQLSHGSSVYIRRIDVHLKGAANGDTTDMAANVESVHVNLFGTHSTGIASTEGSNDLIVPVFGQSITRQEHTVRHPIDNLSLADSITPSVKAFKFDGTAYTLTADRKAIVYLLLEVEKERDVSGRQGANQSSTLKTAADMQGFRTSTFHTNMDESMLGKAAVPGSIKFGMGQY